MDCTKPHLLALAGLLLLLATLGFATASAAPSEVSPQQRFRYVAWDCSDWSMIAGFGDDRGRAILEMLALNRGMTLYCGAEQSNILTKAELWEVGQEHNERDDTVYWGEGGSFRGFTAPQEGWLTDGASGITGISLHRVFEFPREERKRRRTRRDSSPVLPPVDSFGTEEQRRSGAVPARVTAGTFTWSAYDEDPDRFHWPQHTDRESDLPSSLLVSLRQVGSLDKEKALRRVYALIDQAAWQGIRSHCRDSNPGVTGLGRQLLASSVTTVAMDRVIDEEVDMVTRTQESGEWVYADTPVAVPHYSAVCQARYVEG